MKSITIHGLDDALNILIRERARQQQLSLNKTIKKLLEESLGLTSDTIRNHRAEFADLCGIWTTDDRRKFNDQNQELNSIDTGDWT